LFPLSRGARRAVTALLTTVTASALVAAGATPALGAAPTPEKLNPPDRITSMGDSITRGFHTAGLLADVPNNSWSTGGNTTVNSLYNRIRAENPTATSTNRAVTGARMVGLEGQARTALGDDPDVVTILLGANDACTSTEATMTPVATYEAQFRAGMEVLRTGAPDTQILVASVPNIYRLWEIGRNSFGARFAWGLYSICQSMLANPGSTATADEARRVRVRQRVIDYNATLARVCAEYIHCRFDGNAAFNTPFLLSDMSTIDYFHPNVAGQAKAAAVLAPALLDLADRTAPTTLISNDRDADGVDGWYSRDVAVTLGSEDPDLSGSEYDFRMSGATGDLAWTRYTNAVDVTGEGTTVLTARSVDRAGNIEAAQVHNVKIDKTAPAVQVACPAPVVKNGAASAVVSATDGLSGFAQDPNGAFPLDTSVVGTHTHVVEVQDRAGNTAAASCRFTVQYDYSGLGQPVNADGSSLFKAGSTVPLKFRLFEAGGAQETDATPSLSVRLVTTAVNGVDPEVTVPLAPSTGNRFTWFGGEDQYRYNLGTRGLAAGTYEVTITLDGGQQHTHSFSLR
jgi:lysophospholipase L1-like esterase